MRRLILLFLLPVTCSLFSQQVDVYTQIKKHIFEGAGVSIGLYMGHHTSMSDENQDLAVRLVNEDCNMLYLQDYIDIYPSDNPEYFDKRANYIKAAKVYSPNIKMSLVGNKFPTALKRTITVNGEDLEVLDTTDPEIYEKVADWYFKLFQAFAERGVPVEIFNVVNEPDLDTAFRKYHYGQGANTFYAVATLFEQTIPLFFDKFDDPNINTLGMEKPLIMGPSTISPYGCIEYVKYFQEQKPTVWEMIDIVATHQYIRGAELALFTELQGLIGDKPLFQSETHAYKGDALKDNQLEKSHQTVLSLANLFCTAVNNGAQAWFYFESNYPNDYTPAALIKVAWASNNPEPYKHYYVFKQLTSTQPTYSHVLSTTTYEGNSDVIAFRKEGDNHIYVNLANYSSQDKSFDINLLQLGTDEAIREVKMWICDETRDNVIVQNTYTITGNQTLQIDAGAFSVSTLEIELSSSSSINEDTERETLSVITDNMLVRLQSQNNNINAYSIYNIEGKLLISSDNFENQAQHDMSNYGRGIYLVRVQTTSEELVKKIIL